MIQGLRREVFMPIGKLSQPHNRFSGNAAGDGHGSNGENRRESDLLRPRLFARLAATDYEAICRAARVRNFARGEMLHIEGSPPERILLVEMGLVKLTKVGQSGEEVILRVKGPGDVLGVVSLCSSGQHGTTAQVYRACRALVWDAPTFKGFIERFPILHRNLVAYLGEHLQELEERFREVATERVGPRVALQLLRLLKAVGRPVNADVEVELSREELAQMTGTTLFTVSRLLSAWEGRGVVRPRREAVAVCDIPLLETIATDQ
jgi:CRP-like cAMP-binding protein